MTNTLTKLEKVAEGIMSLEEFLHYDDGTDALYELEDGRLLFISESDINQRIASFLFLYFAQLGIPFYRLRIGMELVVMGSRATVRIPDLIVLTEELAQVMKGATRSIILPEMPPPQLVVEVVSPGEENEARDYRYKKSQYQARGIAEYWIVDPTKQQITVLSLVKGLYQEALFTLDAEMASPLLLELGQKSPLTVAQVLQLDTNI